VFKAHPGEIACVLMMPFELEPPLPGFLEEVRTIAHEHGALFILDEMRSGFRMALGGAQEYFSVRADLATYSKAMSNGYAISAIVGRADVLHCLGRTHMASTFYANSAEMVAAITTIALLKESDALIRIWEMGERLMRGLGALISEFGVQAEVVGYPPCPFLRFKSHDEVQRGVEMVKFYSETTKQGVLLHPNHHWFVSAAHTEEDVGRTLEICRKGFEIIRQ
jgi:glutamate-1-semialdehyde aminotransferase